MASLDDNRPQGKTICFGSLDFPFNSEGEAIRAPEARPPLLRNLGMTVRADGGSHVECTLRASIRFVILNFTIGQDGDMVRAMPTRPVPSEGFDVILVALGALSLALCMRCRRPRPALLSEADEIRR